jgi:hypothetical protein
MPRKLSNWPAKLASARSSTSADDRTAQGAPSPSGRISRCACQTASSGLGDLGRDRLLVEREPDFDRELALAARGSDEA